VRLTRPCAGPRLVAAWPTVMGLPPGTYELHAVKVRYHSTPLVVLPCQVSDTVPDTFSTALQCGAMATTGIGRRVARGLASASTSGCRSA
jgi:hypothetical protein